MLEKKANKDISNDVLLEELDRVYRLINNTNRRVEQKLIYIEKKVNYIMDDIKSATIDVAKEREIEELEQRLRKLKGV